MTGVAHTDEAEPLTRREILDWLREEDPEALEALWREADGVRRVSVGDSVHLRGLIEFSNHCRRSCLYCGIRRERRLPRYRLTSEEILYCAGKAAGLEYGTVVLQSGEDPGLDPEWLAAIVRAIRLHTDLAVTLSVGERSLEEYRLWRSAGADRVLLRFETSNLALFSAIHPTPEPVGIVGNGAGSAIRLEDADAGRDEPHPRIRLLLALRDLGYEIGSGIMVGIPGQTLKDLAEDLLTFRRIDLDMIGIGPFIPHPDTPLGRNTDAAPADGARPDELLVLKCVALARLLCPQANIPSTTALATIDRAKGRELGLMRGANVVMPNLTPAGRRSSYEIYPEKACVNETAEACHGCLGMRIHSLGREIGRGRGDSPRALRAGKERKA